MKCSGSEMAGVDTKKDMKNQKGRRRPSFLLEGGFSTMEMFKRNSTLAERKRKATWNMFCFML